MIKVRWRGRSRACDASARLTFDDPGRWERPNLARAPRDAASTATKTHAVRNMRRNMTTAAGPGAAARVQPVAQGKTKSTLQQGVSWASSSEDPGWSYEPLLKEIAALGRRPRAARRRALSRGRLLDGDLRPSPLLYLRRPSTIQPHHPQQAHRLGLSVLLFPIVRLLHPKDGEWRGHLTPRDRAAWMASYRRALTELARLAHAEHVEGLSIGSELSTLDVDVTPWRPLVQEVRPARCYRRDCLFRKL